MTYSLQLHNCILLQYKNFLHTLYIYFQKILTALKERGHKVELVDAFGSVVNGISVQGWKLMSCSHRQGLGQQAWRLLIGWTRVNNQSKARSANWPESWPWLQLISFRFRMAGYTPTPTSERRAVSTGTKGGGKGFGGYWRRGPKFYPF